MNVAHYERNRESKQAKRERLERARAQAVEALTPKPIIAPTEGMRWKGIVDGTEVRVSERWKPSKRARQYHTRERKLAMVAKATVAAPKRDDRALMATMGSIHGNTQ
jgi:hypothetical protein